jgi:spore germination protein KC
MPHAKTRGDSCWRRLRLGLGLAALLAVNCLTAGCWDRVEIQDRAFVLAVAVDVAEAGVAEKPGAALVESFSHGPPDDRYRVTFQIIRFGGVKPGQEKAEGGGVTYLVTGRGPGVFEAVRDATGESSKALWFENMQAIVLSEAVVKRYGLTPVTDFLRRDAEMRWRAQVFVTAGEAAKVLEVQPPTGEAGGIFLANVARRHKKNPHLPTAATDLSFLNQALANKADTIMPVIEPVGKVMKVKGGAMFKGETFVGYMDEYGVKGLRMERGTEKSALITFECPVHPGNSVTFELFRHQTLLKPHVEGDRVYFTLDIAMRGNIGEVQCSPRHDTTSVAFQTEAQKLFAEEIKRNIEHSIAVGQKAGWDMFYFKKNLQAYEPKAWERIKDRWDEIYPTMPVYVTVRVAIINVGEHK